MKKKRNILQKVSIITGVICILLTFASLAALYFKLQELEMQHPVTASLLASSFFFTFISFVFFVMGNADIPSFKLTPAASPVSLDNEKTKEED
ncbi:hypothetical protein ACFL3P_01045 [Pseudomonadota bacterium]